MIHHGDCVDVMAAMDPESVDAIVTDPPYGLEFMGKEWDKLGAGLGSTAADADPFALQRGGSLPFGAAGRRVRYGTDAVTMQAWHQRWAEAAYRVAKPSAYLLAFGGTRTVHRMTVALEDAGWIIRDMLVWGYASGFPKSKASLKPAWEPIVMARKPGPLRMLAIDECRIPFESDGDRGSAFPGGKVTSANPGQPQTGERREVATEPSPLGRWPANIVLTDPIFDGGIEGVVGGGETATDALHRKAPAGALKFTGTTYNGGDIYESDEQFGGYGDSGTYSRFFLVPKAARSDREPVLGGLPMQSEGDGTTVRNARCSTCRKVKFAADNDRCRCLAPTWEPSTLRQNVHPTVKPTDLMRHLVRLVTPTGGTVLDPFLGSGTTALAAEMEGFEWIGIEREAEYVAIAEARLNGTQRGLGLAV